MDANTGLRDSSARSMDYFRCKHVKSEQHTTGRSNSCGQVLRVLGELCEADDESRNIDRDMARDLAYASLFRMPRKLREETNNHVE